MEDPVMSMRNSKISCCVVGCKNAYYNTDKSVRFYNFPQRPYEQKRKEIWINSVRRINSQTNEPWLPKKHNKICSVHFIGNAKSNIEQSPSYNPTLFPKEYRNTCHNLNSSSSKDKRFKRLQVLVAETETETGKDSSMLHKQELDDEVAPKENKVATNIEYICVNEKEVVFEETKIEPIENPVLQEVKFTPSENKNVMNSTKECVTKTYELKTTSSCINIQNIQVGDDKNKNNLYKCTFCSESFEDNREFDIHKKIHIKNYKCTICFQSFSERNIFLDHMEAHRNDNEHKCKVCSNSFKTFNTLSLHMKIHSGDENYKCMICSKSFTVQSYLNIHMETHRNNKNYECKISFQDFRIRRYLNTHMKKHKKDKNYKCKVCSKNFKRQRDLLEHKMKKHNKHNGNKCKCCKSFESKYNMLEHAIEHKTKTKALKTYSHIDEKYKSCSNEKCSNTTKSNQNENNNDFIHMDIKIEPTIIFQPEALTLGNENLEISNNLKIEQDEIKSDVVEVKQEITNVEGENFIENKCDYSAFVQNYKVDDNIRIKLEIDDKSILL